MISLSQQLRKKAGFPKTKLLGNGKSLAKFKRGASTRIAEFCGVRVSTAARWLSGNAEPSIHIRPRVQLLLETVNFDFSPKKTGPKIPDWD